MDLEPNIPFCRDVFNRGIGFALTQCQIDIEKMMDGVFTDSDVSYVRMAKVLRYVLRKTKAFEDAFGVPFEDGSSRSELESFLAECNQGIALETSIRIRKSQEHGLAFPWSKTRRRAIPYVKDFDFSIISFDREPELELSLAPWRYLPKSRRAAEYVSNSVISRATATDSDLEALGDFVRHMLGPLSSAYTPGSTLSIQAS